MKTGRILIFCIFLIFSEVITAFGDSIKIDGIAPTFRDTTGLYGSYFDALNNELRTAFNRALKEINDEIGNIDTMPEEFIQAWGNSSVFSSHGANQRGYGGYDLFAFTVGSMVGIQLPTSLFTIADELENIVNKLNNERDLRLGLNPQIITGQIGINTSKFLLNNLYLGLRFGYMNLDSIGFVEGFLFNSMSLGGMVNYQLVSQKKLAGGLFLWRGLNLGTGFLYQRTAIVYDIKLDPITQNIYVPVFDPSQILPGMPFPELPTALDLKIGPSLFLDMDIITYTIPLEASTSVQLLWFLNIALGFGVDFGFGKSNIKIGMNADANVTGNAATIVEQNTPGNVSASAGGDMSPGLFNPKLMAGLGFSLGPVVIDIPVTWYFTDHGYNVGVTLGIVW
jgi:hypothetical protein